MSFKAYVIMDSPAEKADRMVKTLRNRPGVVSVDLLDDSPQLIMVIEAAQRKKLAKLTVQAISSADTMATVTQLITATSGNFFTFTSQNKYLERSTAMVKTAKATWNNEVLAESDKAILVEGNLYFPPESIRKQYLTDSDRKYHCPWKGNAGYYNIVVDGKTNKDGAWYYYEVTDAAKPIKDYVAFDKHLGVQTEGEAISSIEPTD